MNSDSSRSRVSSWRWTAASSLGEHPVEALAVQGGDHAVVERGRGMGDRDERPLGRNRLDQPRERLAVGDVAGHQLDLAFQLAKLGGQLLRARRVPSAAADQQQVPGIVVLGEPPGQQRPDPGGPAGDEDSAVGERRAAGRARAGCREGNEPRNQQGAVPERELRLAGDERRREQVFCQLAAIGVEEGEAAGVLGVGGADQPGNRGRREIRVLVVRGGERISRDQQQARPRQRLGRDPGLDQFERATGGCGGSLRELPLHGLDRREDVLRGRRAGLDGRLEGREVSVVLDGGPRRDPGRAIADDRSPPCSPERRRERSPVDPEETVPRERPAHPAIGRRRRGSHPVALALEGVGGQLDSAGAREERLPVDPDSPACAPRRATPGIAPSRPRHGAVSRSRRRRHLLERIERLRGGPSRIG